VRRSSVRTLALILLAVPIVLVAPSRLYLGQHWLSDVLGGYAVATLLLVPYCGAYAKWRLDIARARFAGAVRPAGNSVLAPTERG
jgi:membrane-associated phospholipid phosphatase